MSEKSSLPDRDEDVNQPFSPQNRPHQGPGAGLDQTAAYEPLDDATAPYEPLDDATEPYEPLDDPDATRALTRPGVAAGASAGAAAAHYDPDATRVSDAWTGRASVRGPIPPEDGEQWTDQEPEEPGRRWWMPILLGVLGVLAVIAAIAAVMLTGRNDDNVPTPTPPVTRSAAPPASSSPSPPPPSSAPPSSAPPTVTNVTVPPVVGDTLAVARGKLEAVGLVVRPVEREDAAATPGTVLATTPEAGTVVPAGDEITVIVAKAVPSSSPEPIPSPSRPGTGESLSPAAAPIQN